jgi:hypothetical protein
MSSHPNRAELARFFSKVSPVRITGCWLWTAAIKDDGYGVFGLGRSGFGAHVVAYRWFVGAIPDGLQVDHLCRHRRCVNPAHLEAVTRIENVKRFIATRTHCQRGHAVTPENTIRLYSGKGVKANACLACHRLRLEALRRRVSVCEIAPAPVDMEVA